jgi:sulfite reductase (NADPH) hemoprotein beta-component
VTAETPHQAVTGNRLRDGVPIYFAGGGTWSASVADAVIAPDGGILLIEATAGPLPLEAVGPYVIDVTVAEGAIRPVGLKEQIRAYGPTA